MAEERWVELPLPEGVQGAACRQADGVAVFVNSRLGRERRAVRAELHEKAKRLAQDPDFADDQALDALWREAKALRAALGQVLEENEAGHWQRQDARGPGTGADHHD